MPNKKESRSDEMTRRFAEDILAGRWKMESDEDIVLPDGKLAGGAEILRQIEEQANEEEPNES